MIESPTSLTDASRDRVPWLSWLARTALVVLALSIVAAQAPARVKLLGLFSVAVGGAMGVAAAYFTKPHPQRVSRRWMLVLFVMALAGLAGATWLAFRTDASSQTKSPNQQMAESMLKQMERDSAGEMNPLPIASTTDDFRWYLARRVKQLGNWISPWPEIFWSVELLLGSAAAVAGWQFATAHSPTSHTKREPQS